MKNIVLLGCLLISVILACENMCSGHGICQKKDKCECYPGWGAADCSERSCPYSDSWTYSELGDLNHDGQVTKESVKIQWFAAKVPEKAESIEAIHGYAECSNAGICDRQAGECRCFPGYTGAACQRKSCPTATNGTYCSGHGRCISTANLLTRTASKYSSWETEKEYSCYCDDGWSGSSCNERTCPMAFDPIQHNYPTLILGYKPDSQSATHFIRYKYDGVVYQSFNIVTRRIKLESGKYQALCLTESQLKDYAEEVRIALRVMPPLTQIRVEITQSAANCEPGQIVNKDNGDASTSNQHTIRIQVEGVDVNKFLDSEIFDNDKCPECNIIIAGAAKDAVETSVCGNRGLCNTATGLCECFTGFYGNACEIQRAVVKS